MSAFKLHIPIMFACNLVLEPSIRKITYASKVGITSSSIIFRGCLLPDVKIEENFIKGQTFCQYQLLVFICGSSDFLRVLFRSFASGRRDGWVWICCLLSQYLVTLWTTINGHSLLYCYKHMLWFDIKCAFQPQNTPTCTCAKFVGRLLGKSNNPNP
jgi:hypothetical protein